MKTNYHIYVQYISETLAAGNRSTMSEKLCLQWNDFKENVNTAFGSLRDDTDFTDVTLVCEDGQQIAAYKVILASSSPFFQNVLKRNKHSQPLIYMKGVKLKDLSAIVDFLYCGEANVFQENLDSFLSIAEELKLKGLTGQTEDIVIAKTENEEALQMNSRSTYQRDKTIKTDSRTLTNHPTSIKTFDERRVAIPNFTSGDLQLLDEKVKSMMEKSQNLIPSGTKKAYICKVCGKDGEGIAIRDHIEANHLEGVSLPCNVCGKECRSRMILRKHTCVPK